MLNSEMEVLHILRCIVYYEMDSNLANDVPLFSIYAGVLLYLRSQKNNICLI